MKLKKIIVNEQKLPEKLFNYVIRRKIWIDKDNIWKTYYYTDSVSILEKQLNPEKTILEYNGSSNKKNVPNPKMHDDMINSSKPIEHEILVVNSDYIGWYEQYHIMSHNWPYSRKPKLDPKTETLKLNTKDQWDTKEFLSEEFKSLGFYISDHPLNDYKNIFNQLDIKPYKDFLAGKKNDSLIAGTLMSIQEKKSSKGTPFAIAKFSDNYGDYELFIFSEILIKNRDILKEGESFVITLFKDLSGDQKRINVKKIVSLDSLINSSYKKVFIEIDDKLDFQELKQLLEKKGQTEVQLIIRQKDTKFTVKLENPRNFDLKLFNEVKNREYVKKITF